MEVSTVFIWLSFLFSLSAYVPYIYAIWTTRNSPTPVRPQRATWFVWFVIDVVMVIALVDAKIYNAVPIFAAFSVGSALVLALSVKYGKGGYSWIDITCVVIALAGIVLWQTQAEANPQIAVFASMFAAFIGTIPVVRDAYYMPEEEDKLTWVLFAMGGLLNTLAIPEFTLIAAGPTINVFFLQLSINAAIYLGYHRKNRLKLAEMDRVKKEFREGLVSRISDL